MCIAYTVIGRNIREARKRKKMTQDAVAEAPEMTSPSYGRIERGELEVSLKRIAQLSIVLEVPIGSFVEGSVTLPDGSFPTYENPLPDSSDALASMEAIMQGCSEASIRLMLQLCGTVAQADKSNKS